MPIPAAVKYVLPQLLQPFLSPCCKHNAESCGSAGVMVRQQIYLQALAVLVVFARSSYSERDFDPANSKYLQRRSLIATQHGPGFSMLDPDHWERRKVTVGTMAPSHRQLQDKGSNNPSEDTSDTRSLVSDTTNFPYNSIGIVRMLQENTAMGCSGALIHPNYVLTAAHCLYDPDSGEHGALSSLLRSSIQDPAVSSIVGLLSRTSRGAETSMQLFVKSTNFLSLLQAQCPLLGTSLQVGTPFKYGLATPQAWTHVDPHEIEL